MRQLKYMLSTALLCLAFSASAEEKAPSWVINHTYYDSEDSYFRTISAEGTSPDDAKSKAEKKGREDRSFETGTLMNLQTGSDGSIVTQGEHQYIAKSRVVDYWIEPLGNSLYRAYILMETPKNVVTSQYSDVVVSDRYGFTPAVFIPGMAQFKKGSVVKGSLFITAEAVSVAGIIVCEAQRASYNSKIKTTLSSQQKLAYKQKRDNWALARNISIGATAAFYVWNVVDGIFAKGRRHVSVDGKVIAFAPYCAPESSGLAMCFTF